MQNAAPQHIMSTYINHRRTSKRLLMKMNCESEKAADGKTLPRPPLSVLATSGSGGGLLTKMEKGGRRSNKKNKEVKTTSDGNQVCFMQPPSSPAKKKNNNTNINDNNNKENPPPLLPLGTSNATMHPFSVGRNDDHNANEEQNADIKNLSVESRHSTALSASDGTGIDSNLSFDFMATQEPAIQFESPW